MLSRQSVIWLSRLSPCVGVLFKLSNRRSFGGMTGIELDDLTLRQVIAAVASAGWRLRRRSPMSAPSALRQLLPNRRETDVFRFIHEGHRYFGSVSLFDDGRPAEVFLDAGKPGASLQAMARDAAVIASIALQHGVSLEVMRKAITRLDDGSAAGPLGHGRYRA
jgi:hypothetical protein